jgi:hypothetical protein
MSAPVNTFTVVVDTNVFENGLFSEGLFTKLVQRVERKGHDLCVPRVVVWEWAEHAKSLHDAYVSQARFAARRILFSLALDRLDTLRLVDAEVVADEDSPLFTAELVVTGSVVAESWLLDDDGELVQEGGYGHFQVRVRMTADLNSSYEPVDFDLDGRVDLDVPGEP